MTSLTGIKGAVYFPPRAFNAYQTWANYDRHRTHRDMVLAHQLGLNALRVLTSYEYWRENRTGFRDRFEHFVDVARLFDISVVPVLFESIGDPPTRENLTDTAIETAFAVCSPDRSVITQPWRWGGPARFVQWFTARYGSHKRILAVEIMNEPGAWWPRVAFCRTMLRAARASNDDVALTMGCRSLEDNERYDLDVLQFHYNIPPSADHMRRKLREAARVRERYGRPVWLTEWQRTREEPPDRMVPNYESLAPVIRESDLDGDFLWGLMLKPAYMEIPRQHGRLNGIFHEDGTPYSAADARAIAGQDGFEAERHSWPRWTTGSATTDDTACSGSR